MSDCKKIYCCQCREIVSARLTNGGEIYPHRKDLEDLPFWKCDDCKNFVGCHHKTKNRTKPLGCIPNKEVKNARSHIHKILDPMWKSARNRRKARSEIYQKIADKMGIMEYHTAEIKSIEEARRVYRIILDIKKGEI